MRDRIVGNDRIQPRRRKIRMGGGAQVPPDRTEDLPAIPRKVREFLGKSICILGSVRGVCSTVVFLQAEQAEYALKFAQGDYRGSELETEHAALKYYSQLDDPLVPVPVPLQLGWEGDICYLLMSQCDGEPASKVIQGEDRAAIIRHMGRMLAAIHISCAVDGDWRTCLQDQLWFAEQHLRCNRTDPGEFMHEGYDMDQAPLLRELHKHVPEAGSICVLHGDYRPKNLLWNGRDRRISAVLDWAFCDIGDPYYDLAIVMYYMKTDEERHLFLDGYGMAQIDERRLHYFENLSKFTNV